MSSAICFKLDLSKILSFGNGIKESPDATQKTWSSSQTLQKPPFHNKIQYKDKKGVIFTYTSRIKK